MSTGSTHSGEGVPVQPPGKKLTPPQLAYNIPTIRTLAEYIVQEKVGEGTYGKVFKARDKTTDQLVALKQIRISSENDGLPITAIREIKLLKSLKHDNIVLLKEVVIDVPEDPNTAIESIYMVFEYMEHDLSGLSQCKGDSFIPGQIQCYIKQLLEGLYHCHKKKILHRDIKGANMLINNSGVLKLADFGLARKMKDMNSQYTNRVVTLWYRAPELLLGTTSYTPAIDMWSVGCILLELYLGRAPFPGTTEPDQLHKIYEVCGTPTDENWPDAFSLPMYKECKPKTPFPRRLKEFMGNAEPETFDLIDKLLCLDPKKRITAEQALDHDYFFKPRFPPDAKDLPKYDGSYHEMFSKRRRQEQKHAQSKRFKDNLGNPQQRNPYNRTGGPPRMGGTKYPPDLMPQHSGRQLPYGYRNPEYRPPPRAPPPAMHRPDFPNNPHHNPPYSANHPPFAQPPPWRNSRRTE